MLQAAVAFLAGNVLVHLWPAIPPLWPWGAVLTLVFGLALLARSRAASAFLIAVAFTWFSASLQLANDLPAVLEGEDLLVQGIVASLPDSSDRDPQFDFDVSAAQEGVPSRLRLSWYETDERPRAGESWQFVVRLKRRSGFANPGGYDYEAQLLREGVGATGYIREDVSNRRISAGSNRYPVLRLRAFLAEAIASSLGAHSMLGIIQGLAVGHTGAMSADQWRVFAATGTTHLMAISGLHIAMVAALGAWVGRQIVRWRAAQRLRLTAVHGEALAGSAAALIYAALAGLSVPTQRTLVMLLIVLLARLTRRQFSVSNAMSLAIVAVLIVDPFAPLAAGAWLSFGAVAAILIATSGRRVAEGKISAFVRTQWAVSLGLLPVLLGAFGSFSVISPLVNAIAVPMFTCLIVPCVLFGTLIAAVSSSAGAYALWLPARLLDASWPALEWCAQLPIALWHFPQFPLVLHVALLIGALILVLPGIAATRTAAIALCVPALIWRPQPPAEGEARLAILDVGQGLATVVQTRSHVLIYDTGPAFRSGRDTGELVVLPYLYSQGIRSIDTLVVSHGDLDHQGGMRSILKGVRVERLLVGPSVTVTDTYGAQVDTCERGQRWEWDGVQFEILHPQRETQASDNESSCVLSVVAARRALLTGDIQREAERALVAGALASSEVVVVPHHGSRTSSTPEFVEAVHPTFAVFSVGYRNRWGFPKADVVERWNSAGAHALTTVASGAVVIELTDSSPAIVHEYRREHPRYWRAR